MFSFRKFSEILRNGRILKDFRTLSIVSGLFSETRLFAAPSSCASLKLMTHGLHKNTFGLFIGQSSFVVTGALIAIIDVAIARNTF